jgi:hypothetical protein
LTHKLTEVAAQKKGWRKPMKRYQIVAAGLLIAGMIVAPFASSQVQLRVNAGHHQGNHYVRHPYHRSRARVRIEAPVRHQIVHPQSDDRHRHENH